MTYEEDWKQSRAEESRLRSQIKAFEKERQSLPEPVAKERARSLQEEYNRVHFHVLELKREYKWGLSVEREFISLEQGD